MAVNLKTAEFVPWTTLIDQFVFNKDEPYFNIMVPTADTTRYFSPCLTSSYDIVCTTFQQLRAIPHSSCKYTKATHRTFFARSTA